MFLNKAKAISHPLACVLSEHSYALVALKTASSVDFHQQHTFKEASPLLMAKSLSDEVDKYNLFGRPCQLILPVGSYQLLLMDALDLPEQEMAKALRWQLKGLIDYPLNDIVVDAFPLPEHGGGKKRKKVFVAVTLQSVLKEKIALLENALLQVRGVSIAELALAALLSRMPIASNVPYVVISHDHNYCQLYIFHERHLYLCRSLAISARVLEANSSVKQDLLLEIQRSLDYCLTELKLPEPKHIYFTPHFYQARDLLFFLHEQLDKHVELMDINALFTSKVINAESMASLFYALGGAFMLLKEER